MGKTNPESDFEQKVRASVPDENLFVNFGTYWNGMIELKNGNLMTISAVGRHTSTDGGKNWDASEPVVGGDGKPIGEAFDQLVRLKSGAIGGFNRGAFSKNQRDEKYGHSAWFRRSDDEGKSWSEAVKMGEPYNNVCLHKEKVPIVTERGRIVAPVYTLLGKTEEERGRALYGDEYVRVGAHGYENFFTYCWVYYSDDEGRTWETSEGKGSWGKGGELFVTLDYSAGGHYRCNEPVVAEVSEEHLLMILRTPLGRLYQSWSADDGRSWTRPEPTALASALAPAALARIPGTGDLLVVWNQASADEITLGLQRNRLTAAVSRDGGASWDCHKNVFFQRKGEPARVDPSPIKPYRAMENAPRVPMGNLCATYPSIVALKETILICFACRQQSNYISDGKEMKRGEQTHVCLGLPVSWFYEKD